MSQKQAKIDVTLADIQMVKTTPSSFSEEMTEALFQENGGHLSKEEKEVALSAQGEYYYVKFDVVVDGFG